MIYENNRYNSTLLRSEFLDAIEEIFTNNPDRSLDEEITLGELEDTTKAYLAGMLLKHDTKSYHLSEFILENDDTHLLDDLFLSFANSVGCSKKKYILTHAEDIQFLLNACAINYFGATIEEYLNMYLPEYKEQVLECFEDE